MKDGLDSLSDAKISEVFAVEVAEWPLTYKVRQGREVLFRWNEDCTKIEVPVFAKSADAVLPFIEKSDVFPEIMRPWQNLLTEGAEPKRVWEVRFDSVWATAPTFARAACIALIRAGRVEKGRR